MAVMILKDSMRQLHMSQTYCLLSHMEVLISKLHYNSQTKLKLEK
jgi:hypothetical protein